MIRLQHGLSLALALTLALLLSAMGGQVAHAREITGFLTFETGEEGGAINLPGIKFTTTPGDLWAYGDVRTHKYNAPYPSDCSDRPADIASPVCQYAVGENIFAWAGAIGVGGRFDFTQGTASFVEFDLPTGSGMTVLAYNTAGKAIAAIYVRPNLNGSAERAVQLDAPAGERIAYVTLNGDANLWLFDNLATDAPGVPDQRRPVNAYPAQLSLALHGSPNATVAPDDIITLSIIVANHGRGIAKNTIIRLPLAGLPVAVLDATFSRADAWVSTLDTDALTIHTGGLGPNGDSLTATLKLRVSRDVAIGSTIAPQLTLHWSDAASGGEGLSNTLALRVADASTSASNSSIISENNIYSTSIFIPGEPVGIWYDTPAGLSVALTTTSANHNGAVKIPFEASDLPSGIYTLIAHGLWSDLTATTQIIVP